jgi:hypothetical protein
LGAIVRRRVRAAIFFAAAFLSVGVWLSAGPCWAADDEPHAMQFSGRDIWRNGAFAYSGLLLAPGGFEQDGFMLKLLLSGGAYRYVSDGLGGLTVIGMETLAQILPGFRIKRGNAEFKFFFGPELQWHKLWPDDPESRLRGRDFGLRMAAELWYEPTRNSLIAGDAALSSIATGHSARIAAGWRMAEELLTDGVYVGPEMQYFHSDQYRHHRFGLHITSMKTEATEWSAAAGWARDSDGRSGPYLRLGLSSRIAN